MAKVITFPQTDNPLLTEALHDLIIACGYGIFTYSTECLDVTYHLGHNNKRLVFRDDCIHYSQNDGYEMNILFSAKFNPLTTVQTTIMEVLQAIGAIDYLAIPECRLAVKEAILSAMAQTEPAPQERITDASDILNAIPDRSNPDRCNILVSPINV